jgi:hypothetical protein
LVRDTPHFLHPRPDLPAGGFWWSAGGAQPSQGGTDPESGANLFEGESLPVRVGEDDGGPAVPFPLCAQEPQGLQEGFFTGLEVSYPDIEAA